MPTVLTAPDPDEPRGGWSVAIGDYATARGTYAVAIGHGPTATGDQGVAIGDLARPENPRT